MTDPDLTILALFALGVVSYVGWLGLWIVVQFAKAAREDEPEQEKPE